MSHRCLEEQELAALLDRPLDDAVRREADACARCASLLAAMSAFLAGDRNIPRVEVDWADLRLSAFVASRLTVVAAGRPPRRVRVAGFLERPLWPWGAGVAAVAALLVLIIGQVPGTSTAPSGTLRGGTSAPDSLFVGEIVLTAAGEGSPDGLRLDWPPVPRADHYQVILFTAALDTVGVLGPVAEPTVTVSGPLLKLGGPEGVLCRVRALADGVPVAASRLKKLPTP
jgi:hypothetical protein